MASEDLLFAIERQATTATRLREDKFEVMIDAMEGERGTPPEAKPERQKLSDAERWVDKYGDYLFRFAMTRLRDPLKAEEAVQETFLAALRGGNKFGGRSAEKSWLAGILKNKICDHFRRVGREIAFTDLEFYSEEERESFVPISGAWRADGVPQEWAHPGEDLDNDLFWRTYHECSQKLPRKIAAAFSLREVDGIESKEVCGILDISETSLWVMLHRARMALRRCLERNWFGKQI